MTMMRGANQIHWNRIHYCQLMKYVQLFSSWISARHWSFDGQFFCLWTFTFKSSQPWPFLLLHQVSDFYPDLTDTLCIIKVFAILLTAVSKVCPTVRLASYTRYWLQFVQGELGLLAGISGLLDDVFIKKPANQHDKVNSNLDWSITPHPPSLFVVALPLTYCVLSLTTQKKNLWLVHGILSSGLIILTHYQRTKILPRQPWPISWNRPSILGLVLIVGCTEYSRTDNSWPSTPQCVIPRKNVSTS